MKFPTHLTDTETPYYYYDLDVLEKTIVSAKNFSEKYGYKIHYAIKANGNDRILAMMKSAGFGVDCVSGNEIKAAIDAGFKGNEIAFAGVGKTNREIEYGLQNQIFSFNVESISELKVISEIAEKTDSKANIALRINPNVDALTHAYITTGLEENKFGINVWELDHVIEFINQNEYLDLKGLHFHIGSQITDMNVFKQLCIKVNKMQEIFFEHRIIVEHINVGGGLGINYHNPDSEIIPDFEGYFEVFNKFLLLWPKQELHFELGRSLVGQCGSLITKVLYIKEGAARRFAIVDAGMTDLIRPALYQSFHFIDVISPHPSTIEKYDVVGPICESTDVFRKSIDLPRLKRGDLLAIRSAGAYGQVMSLEYNMREKPRAVYSN